MARKDQVTPSLTVNGRVEQWNVTPAGKVRRIGAVHRVGHGIADGNLFQPFWGFGRNRVALPVQPDLAAAVALLLAKVPDEQARVVAKLGESK